MKSFTKLLDGLRMVLKKHPEVHYQWPVNPTEMDLNEAAFVIEEYLSRVVIEDDSLQDWLDSYRFFKNQ